MAATLYDLIMKGCSIYIEGSFNKGFENKLKLIASRFSTLSGFKSVSIKELNELRTHEGEKCFKNLTSKEQAAITTFQGEIDLNKNIAENFIKMLTKEFVSKQILMLSSLSIDKFNVNPILCRALNLRTVEEFVRYNAYQSIGRSIVTSMGFLVQNLLLYSSEYVFDGKHYDEGDKTKFDLVIDGLDEVKSFIEVKSGFNDMDKGQVKHYAEEIRLVEEAGHRGYIGVTYGRKEDNTITAGLLRTYVPEWENKTLVGRELWDFISGRENYHQILIENIESVANTVLSDVSIVQKIESKVEELITEFTSLYDSLDAYYESLW